MKPRVHTAIYGNIALLRGYCSECKGYAFILEGKMACCGERSTDAPERFKRMSDCPEFRRGPSVKWQKYIMAQQHCRCFYCNRTFGSTVYRSTKPVRLKVNWDHINPYTYSLDNRNQNFVAACHVCNGIKSSLIFRSVDDATIYILERWKDKGYTDLSSVRIELQPETSIAKVL